MKKANDFQNLTVEEIEAFIEDSQKEIFELTNELKMNRKLDKPHLLKERKKERARAHTVLTAKRKEAL